MSELKPTTADERKQWERWACTWLVKECADKILRLVADVNRFKAELDKTQAEKLSLLSDYRTLAFDWETKKQKIKRLEAEIHRLKNYTSLSNRDGVEMG